MARPSQSRAAKAKWGKLIISAKSWAEQRWRSIQTIPAPKL
jgi:hypothetical protein